MFPPPWLVALEVLVVPVQASWASEFVEIAFEAFVKFRAVGFVAIISSSSLVHSGKLSGKL